MSVNVFTVVEKQAKAETVSKGTVSDNRLKMSPLQSRYYKGDSLTNTATIEFIVAVSSLILQNQGFEGDVIPLDFLVAVHKEVKGMFPEIAELKNSQGNAKARIKAHMQDSRKVATVSKRALSEELPAVTSLVLSEDLQGMIKPILYDFPL